MHLDSSPDLDGIVLVRLLVRPKNFTVAHLAADLGALLGLEGHEVSRRAAEESLARLKERGLIWRDTKLLLTDEGTSTAYRALGFTRPPKRQSLDWRRARKLLLAQRFGLGAGAVDRAGSSDHLAAWVVAREANLQLREHPTPGAVLRALAWRALGLPDSGPLGRRAALGALLGVARPGAAPQTDSIAERRQPENGTPSAQAELPPPSPHPLDPRAVSAFGSKVNELARSARKGRWVGDKVFIAQVWEDFRRQDKTNDLSLARFKEHLAEAARGGHVLLSRADLIDAYPPEELRKSQLEAGGELYHFVETQHLR